MALFGQSMALFIPIPTPASELVVLGGPVLVVPSECAGVGDSLKVEKITKLSFHVFLIDIDPIFNTNLLFHAFSKAIDPIFNTKFIGNI